MTAELDDEDPRLLPVSHGHDEYAGSPPRGDDGYLVAYLCGRVRQRDATLPIFGSFAHVGRKDVADLRVTGGSEAPMFRRFLRQWNTVHRMAADVKVDGAGVPCLCAHSAGSGETRAIARTVHDRVKVHARDGAPIFDSVVIVEQPRLSRRLQPLRGLGHEHRKAVLT